MIVISENEWKKIHRDYKQDKGKGKRSCFLGCIQKDGGTTLVYENKHFIIKGGGENEKSSS